jgi:DNA-binding winged helix-turn-helix (wHTH) protein
MSNKQFIINNRFWVNHDVSFFTDNETGLESRLEPRLMNLLCYFKDRVNQLVTREELVKELWNDYGGGDEALNQAISFLRKILDDSNKETIETIPKKGYVFKATITFPENEIVNEEKPVLAIRQGKKRFYWLAALLIVVIAGGYFIYKVSIEDNRTKLPDMLPANTNNADANKEKENKPNSGDVPKDSSARTNADESRKVDTTQTVGADVLTKKAGELKTKKISSDSIGADVRH